MSASDRTFSSRTTAITDLFSSSAFLTISAARA
jgi:hypothetical protein